MNKDSSCYDFFQVSKTKALQNLHDWFQVAELKDLSQWQCNDANLCRLFSMTSFVYILHTFYSRSECFQFNPHYITGKQKLLHFRLWMIVLFLGFSKKSLPLDTKLGNFNWATIGKVLSNGSSEDLLKTLIKQRYRHIKEINIPICINIQLKKITLL